MKPYRQKVQEAAQYLRQHLPGRQPEVALILGSGLGDLVEELQGAIKIAYREIPHFPVSTVQGHQGYWVSGRLEGIEVICLQGRVHPYEGYGMQEVVFPVRVLGELGVGKLLVTNAAGGINLDFQPGDLMLISDHINFMFRNPLVGPNEDSWGPRFPDMSTAYDATWRQKAREVAGRLGITLREGTYIAVLGPSYETPAEIRAFRRLGADAVGMSTVPEVIAARHMGMRVLGISCISNMAAGILEQPLKHEEVVQTSQRAKERFARLIKGVLPEMAERVQP